LGSLTIAFRFGCDVDCPVQSASDGELFAELFAPVNNVDLEHVELVADYLAWWRVLEVDGCAAT